MTLGNLTSLTTDELVARFRADALRQEDVLLDSDTDTYNVLYDDMTAIDEELKRRGEGVRRALLNLLDDENLRVRYETAVRVFDIDPVKARATLNDIVAYNQMPEAGDAGMALYFKDELGRKPS
jgi:hypothetical protein